MILASAVMSGLLHGYTGNKSRICYSWRFVGIIIYRDFAIGYVSVCPSVCLSVCHTVVMRQNQRTNAIRLL